MMTAREEMLSKLADADDHFAEVLLQSNEDIALDAEVLSALRRLTLKQKIVPVICGSALRQVTRLLVHPSKNCSTYCLNNEFFALLSHVVCMNRFPGARKV